MAGRQRIDRLLVERGLFETRAKAQAAIAAGLVTANGRQVAKPSDEIAVDARLEAQPAFPWVSRGGVKLAGALERYPIEIEGHICLDVGASTGGFTEVLVRDRCRHRAVASEPSQSFAHRFDGEHRHPQAGGNAPARPPRCRRHRRQLHLAERFEAPRSAIKKGIVRDEAVHRAVCDDIEIFAETLGCTDIAVFASSLPGGDGNQEFFLGARRG